MKLLKENWVLIVTLFLGLIPLIWFFNRSGYLINGVDTNFPLSPDLWFYRRLFVWNPINNAGSDFSSSTAGLFFHLIQFIPFQLGFNLQIVEIVSLVFWFLMIVLGSFIFIRSYFKNDFLIQIIFICFYSFNTYLFNTWENVKVANLSLVAAIPLGLATLNYGRQSKYSKSIILTVVTAFLVSGTGINPAYFIAFWVVVLAIFISDLIVNPREYKKILKVYLIFSLIIVLINSYWILPSINFILNSISASGSIQNLGFNNWLDSLSENTSILNILRLQGAWDWYAFDQITGLPLYLSYTLNYFYVAPFILFSFLIPFLAILGLIFRDLRFKVLYIFSGILVILGIFLGVGSHLPTGSAYKFLSNNLPFFSLFRSPWYIFTPLLILGYSLLTSLFFYKLKEISNISLGFTIFWRILVVVLIISNFFYCYPLVNGKVFRITQTDSFFVKFPSYVLETKAQISETKGRIIGYPADEIENFNWGYRGVESILQLIVDRELIYSSLNYSDSMTSALIKEFYTSIGNNELFIAKSLAKNLNISTIFSKNDQLSLAPKLPEDILFLPKETIGKWEFYKFLEEDQVQKIKTYNKALLVTPFNSDAIWSLSLSDSDEILVNAKDSVVNENELRNMSYGDVYSVISSQQKAVNEAKNNKKDTTGYEPVDLSVVFYDFELLEDGEYSIKIEDLMVDKFGLSSKGSWNVILDGNQTQLDIIDQNDSFISFAPIFLKSGKHKITINLENSNLINNSDFSEEMKETNLIYRDKTFNYLVVNNHSKKEVAFLYDLKNFDSNATYFIKTNYIFNFGEKPRLIAYQTNNKAPLKREGDTLAALREWSQYSFFFEPVRTDSGLSIQLIIPPVFDPVEYPTGSRSSFDNLEVYPLFTNKLSLTKRVATDISTTKVISKKVSSVEYLGQVTNGQHPHSLVLFENFSPFWELSLFTEYGELVKYEPPHFTANFYANGWYIDGMPEKYTFKIYYKPQKYFIVGAIISLTTLLISISFLIINYAKKRK